MTSVIWLKVQGNHKYCNYTSLTIVALHKYIYKYNKKFVILQTTCSKVRTIKSGNTILSANKINPSLSHADLIASLSSMDVPILPAKFL